MLICNVFLSNVSKLLIFHCAKCSGDLFSFYTGVFKFSCRLTFLKKLQELLGDKYIYFYSLNYLENTSYVLGSELWEDDISSLLSIEV